MRSLEAEQATFLLVSEVDVKEGGDSEAVTGGPSLTAGEQHEGFSRSRAIPVDEGKLPITNKLVDVEGTFSLKLNSSSAACGTSNTNMSEASDEVRDLPVIAKAGKTGSSLFKPANIVQGRIRATRIDCCETRMIYSQSEKGIDKTFAVRGIGCWRSCSLGGLSVGVERL